MLRVTFDLNIGDFGILLAARSLKEELTEEFNFYLLLLRADYRAQSKTEQIKHYQWQDHLPKHANFVYYNAANFTIRFNVCKSRPSANRTNQTSTHLSSLNGKKWRRYVEELFDISVQ